MRRGERREKEGKELVKNGNETGKETGEEA